MEFNLLQKSSISLYRFGNTQFFTFRDIIPQKQCLFSNGAFKYHCVLHRLLNIIEATPGGEYIPNEKHTI
jgi:hypothetical protein